MSQIDCSDESNLEMAPTVNTNSHVHIVLLMDSRRVTLNHFQTFKSKRNRKHWPLLISRLLANFCQHQKILMGYSFWGQFQTTPRCSVATWLMKQLQFLLSVLKVTTRKAYIVNRSNHLQMIQNKQPWSTINCCFGPWRQPHPPFSSLYCRSNR